jgi:hypothetical protein
VESRILDNEFSLVKDLVSESFDFEIANRMSELFYIRQWNYSAKNAKRVKLGDEKFEAGYCFYVCSLRACPI